VVRRVIPLPPTFGGQNDPLKRAMETIAENQDLSTARPREHRFQPTSFKTVSDVPESLCIHYPVLSFAASRANFADVLRVGE
jgi:hypothetical protein